MDAAGQGRIGAGLALPLALCLLGPSTAAADRSHVSAGQEASVARERPPRQVPPGDTRARKTVPDTAAWISTYRPPPAPPTLIRGATVWTAAGEELEDADLLVRDGKIAAVGRGLEPPPEADVVEAAGRFLTPGLVDSHSHLGVSPTPEVAAHFDNNEVGVTTPELWMEHAVWPQGPGFARALAAGVTTAQLLPGSGDLIEGRTVTVKLLPGRTAQDMIVPGSPRGLKMACGENPKRGSGFPDTRMGNVAGWRSAFARAEAYRGRWDRWRAAGEGEPPGRDLGLETLTAALRGDILLQVHCYRADDMLAVLELAREFGLRVRSFHHAVEAYKIRDRLVEHGASASVWSDWWGFKMEALDGIPENAALVDAAGGRAIIHSDSDLGIQLLNQDAARAMHAGRRAGIEVSRDRALRWITLHPAWALGLEDRIGTLEPGKDADVVLWSADPFSVYARVDRVWIDGALAYDRRDAGRRPTSDFEVGGPSGH